MQKYSRIAVMGLLVVSGCSGQTVFPVLSGPYLGQQPPGLEPQLFAPDIISTDRTELNCTFAPGGKEVYWTVWQAGHNTIMTAREIGGRWTKPEIAPFSGKFSDVDPYITTDGKRLYFSSMRPLTGDGESKDSDLWYLERTGDGWGSPVHLEQPNTAGQDDYYTSISNAGVLYYSVFPCHDCGGDLYMAQPAEGGFFGGTKLDEPLSSPGNDHDPFIAPDGSYLIFTSNRPGGFGRGDLYISFRQVDGGWSEPVNMGPEINSGGYDFCALLSPDGKYLLYTRNLGGNGDIYWVDAAVIDSLRPE
ncbi:MAG: hypothetical protein V3W14_10670 [Candidatus Neomarinimicrobiota bacterium]